MLSALHFMMTRAADKKVRPGEYRTNGVSGGPNRPPVYSAPDPEQVPELMDELIHWLAEGDLDVPALVRASMAHLNLVSIHPWSDGNGRMSRAVHTLVLAREGILAPELSSIEEWLGADEYNTREYYGALRDVRTSWQPERDAGSWIRFCLTAHHLQAQEVQRRFEAAARLWFRLERLAEQHRLDERTVSALYAATQGHLRRTTYQAEEALTRDQALVDLRTLRRLDLGGRTPSEGAAACRPPSTTSATTAGGSAAKKQCPATGCRSTKSSGAYPPTSQRRERARVRSEKGIRFGGRPVAGAA
ncbi:Fic family protein [Streptomyces mirabilis]|uniref:Fic family protein n=1 Tax=Streptomyces mirabilis TaxID=68239 RepID=UPI00364BE277